MSSTQSRVKGLTRTPLDVTDTMELVFESTGVGPRTVVVIVSIICFVQFLK